MKFLTNLISYRGHIAKSSLNGATKFQGILSDVFSLFPRTVYSHTCHNSGQVDNVRNLKQIFVSIPSGKTLTCTADTVDELKQKIFTKCGIPTSKQYLFYQNKPLHKTTNVTDGSNVHVLLKLCGGNEECEICSFPGEFRCSECNEQITCRECCEHIHKHPRKVNHKPHQLCGTNNTSDSGACIYNPVSTSPSCDTSSVCDDGAFDEYTFTDSPTLNDTFEHAARIATLAQSFDLTKFKDFQRKVIENTLNGKDSIIVQPTGSGKSLCYQLPPVYQNKKAIVVCPTISLMNDQVNNLSQKNIKATFLGSAQLDKAAEDRVFMRDSEEALIFVTPEWIAKQDKRQKVKELADNNMLSLIAIDEAHLYHQWQEFRTSYKDLEVIKYEFPSVPILALTATAPSEVMESIKKLVRQPLASKAGVNRPNIYLECEELQNGKDLAYFASRVVEKIGNECSIIYTDFINSVGPIMSELCALNVDSVAYYGEMDVKSRNESYHRWKNGEVNVMVATSAFGMGIDKSDIKHIVRLGVPENMCSWAQELGRAGRGGGNATATIYYSASDIDHAGTWIRNQIHNVDYCSRILKEFGSAWQYVMSHLSGECRRKVFLQQFGEEKEVNVNDCCDVCTSQHSITLVDRRKELNVIIDAIDTIGMKGELKLAQWIRGSTLQWTAGYNKAAPSYGNSMAHSELWWRRVLRQLAASGALDRQLKSLIKKNSHYCIQGLYQVSPKGRTIISNNETFKLPMLEECRSLDQPSCSNRKRSLTESHMTETPTKKRMCINTRAGKGTHGLRIVKLLLEDKENWKHISSKNDYQYLGVFPNEQMQAIYYSSDCTKLDQACSTDPHFLWHDDQLSKGKVNKDYSINVQIGDKEEQLIYQCAPCNGVKLFST